MTKGRREIFRQFTAVDEAYKAGDLAALRAALGDPPDFPNCLQPFELAVGGYPLEYAIYWSPLSFIEVLLAPKYEAGAMEILTRKEAIRILEDTERRARVPDLDIKRVRGGALVQDNDSGRDDREAMTRLVHQRLETHPASLQLAL